MSDSTTKYGFPFPVDEEAPDGPVQIGALAAALDSVKWLSGSVLLTVGVINNGTPAALGTGYGDVAGTEKEITTEGKAFLLGLATFKFGQPVGDTAGDQCQGRLVIDGAPLGSLAESWWDESAHPQAARQSSPAIYLPELTAGKHTLKLQAKCTQGHGTLYETRFIYALLARA